MALNKSRGNMYGWVTHTHSHLRGRCPHGCSYCYVQAHERRWHSGAFAGPLRLEEKELRVNYGAGRTIFVEHQNDLFAEAVPSEWINAILDHCAAYPRNSYVLQTKNPGRIIRRQPQLPPPYMLGVTVETNRYCPEIMGQSPPPQERLTVCRKMCVDFITIEPIMAFDLKAFVSLIRDCNPRWVNIGADSKGHHLPEPTAAEVAALVARLDALGIEVREKRNLGRLMEG